MVLSYFLPFHIPSNIEPLDARGIDASILKKMTIPFCSKTQKLSPGNHHQNF